MAGIAKCLYLMKTKAFINGKGIKNDLFIKSKTN